MAVGQREANAYSKASRVIDDSQLGDRAFLIRSEHHGSV